MGDGRARLIRWDERGRWRVPYTLEEDWGATLASIGGPFTTPERYDSGYRQEMTPETLEARVLSTSYIATQSPDEQATLSDQVRALVAPLGDRFDVPYVTTAWVTHRT